MERHEQRPLSSGVEVDPWRDLAAGLRYNRAGRRRALRMLLALAVVVPIATGLALLLG